MGKLYLLHAPFILRPVPFYPIPPSTVLAGGYQHRSLQVLIKSGDIN